MCGPTLSSSMVNSRSKLSAPHPGKCIASHWTACNILCSPPPTLSLNASLKFAADLRSCSYLPAERMAVMRSASVSIATRIMPDIAISRRAFGVGWNHVRCVIELMRMYDAASTLPSFSRHSYIDAGEVDRASLLQQRARWGSSAGPFGLVWCKDIRAIPSHSSRSGIWRRPYHHQQLPSSCELLITSTASFPDPAYKSRSPGDSLNNSI